MSVSWFVGFRCTDLTTGQTKQFQFRDKINSFKTKDERKKAGKILSAELLRLLADGWNPFIKEVEPTEKQEIKTLKELIDDCVLLKCATLRKFSQKGYKHAAKYFLLWLKNKGMSHIFPNHFTKAMAVEYMDSLLKRGFNALIFWQVRGVLCIPCFFQGYLFLFRKQLLCRLTLFFSFP